jgi:hypothetical protein
MVEITHPATGRTINVPETRARVHRKHGWVDVNDVAEDEPDLTGLEDLSPEQLAELHELATQGAPPANPAGDGTTETPEV